MVRPTDIGCRYFRWLQRDNRLTPDRGGENREVSDLFNALFEGDDEDKLEAARELNERGLVDDEAVDLMEKEVENN